MATEEIEHQIRFFAASEWPDDYAMQAHVIAEQRSAFGRLMSYKENLDLENEIVATCLDKAQTDWPRDFAMQLHVFEGQVKSASDFFEAECDDLPVDVFEGIKLKSFSKWPGDYEMMLHVLNEQVEAWRSINL